MQIQQIKAHQIPLMHALLDCFSDVFEQPLDYSNARPTPEYLSSLLSSEEFIALIALDQDKLVGGLAAYELKKFEQMRSEIYIYDLAVYQEFRRQGVATKLIQYLQKLAADKGAWVIFVQADDGDTAAMRLYHKLGTQERVLHYDIDVPAYKKP